MKKALAVLLALVMVLGTATVAFAKSKTDKIQIDENNVYTYDSKAKKMFTANSYTPGQTYYFLMENYDADYPTTGTTDSRIKSTSALENYRLSYSVAEGKKIVQSVGMVVKDVNSFDSNMPGFLKGKYAFIAITIKENYSNDSIDVDIELKPTAKGSSSYLYDANGSEMKNMSFNFTATIAYDVLSAGSFTTIDDNAPVVNFEDIEDTEPIQLYFGDYVEYDINAKGQSELFLKYTDDPTDTKMDLADKYPDANIEYHIFHGTKKTFRRSGTLYIKASTIGENKAPYIYEIDTNGALTQTKPKYDTSEERFVITTTTLKNYVVSDVPLKTTSSSSSEDEEEEDIEDESSSPSEPRPPITPSEGENDNPATGANDFVGLAVALAAVSFVGIGLAARKRK